MTAFTRQSVIEPLWIVAATCDIGPDRRHFMENILYYNNSVAFASLGPSDLDLYSTFEAARQ